MRWVTPLYYVLLSLVDMFLLLACVAFPLAFLIVIPVSVFLFATPSLLKSKKSQNIELCDADRRINKLLYERQTYEAKLGNMNAILSENLRVLSACVPSMSGEVYEHYVGNRLSIDGYTEIQYTRRTGDFGGDIVCRDPDGIKTCVQCKRYQDNVGIEGVQAAISGRIYYQCDRAMVISNKNFTPAAKELAEKAGVELRGAFY